MEKFQKPYIIGETAYNHEGDIDYMLKMIDDIAEIGLDAVKIHMLLDLESYMQKGHSAIEESKNLLFDESELDRAISHAEKKGLDVIALCDDVKSLEYVKNKGEVIKMMEIHSTGLNDWFLLQEAAGFNGTIILGIGGSAIDEIVYAVDFLKARGKEDIMLMYGFQSYPTNYNEISLSRMLKMRDLFGLPVGYADHTAYDDPANEFVSASAATMGINILEKHYTPDYGVKRIDHHSAVGKQQMINIKGLVEIALKVYGDGSLKMSDAELAYGNTGPMKKAIVAKTNIKKGEKLSLDNLWFKRTEEGSTLKQNQLLQLVGLEAAKDISEDEIIDFSKVNYEFKKISVEDVMHINIRSKQ